MDGLITPYDFNLTKLDFVTSSGQIIDLRAIFVQIDIFQDIFSNVMSGKLDISDATNIFGHLPTFGSEFLHIIYDKPGRNSPIDKTFRIYKRSPIVQEKPTSQRVQLNFCSEELLISKGLTFSKVYSNMLISDMVKDIASNTLKIDPNDFKDENIEKTVGLQSLIVPYYNPVQTLNWLSSKAISSYAGASYLFYENTIGYNFKSIQSLMDSPKVVAVYNYNLKNVDSADLNTDFYDVSKYEISETPNTLDGMMSGQFSGKLMTLDILRQKFTTLELNGNDLFDASEKLSEGRSFTDFSNRINTTSFDSYGSYRKFYPTNIGQDQAKYISGKQEIHPSNIEKWLLVRNAQLMQLMGMRIKLIVPGNNVLKVGDIIQFNLPSVEPQTGKNEGELKRKLDPYMSGKYMITALRDRISVRTYETVIEICRDTLSKNLPNAANQNPAFKENYT
jgi:hypothetical protein